MNKTAIDWTEESWNPVHGCTPAGIECKNCYAEGFAKRLAGQGAEGYSKDNPFAVVMMPDKLDDPKEIKKPTMIFAVSMGDLFHEKVPFQYIEKVLQVIKDCPQHIFQILTKRPHRMAWAFNVLEKRHNMTMAEYLPNLWAGTSVGSRMGIPRLGQMERINTRVKFVSFEPLIEDLGNLGNLMHGLDWIIIGGETGRSKRKMEKEWVERILQYKPEQIPWFFKQWNTKKKNTWEGEVIHQYPDALEKHFAALKQGAHPNGVQEYFEDEASDMTDDQVAEANKMMEGDNHGVTDEDTGTET